MIVFSFLKEVEEEIFPLSFESNSFLVRLMIRKGVVGKSGLSVC